MPERDEPYAVDHKEEDGDDSPEGWSYTIMGSYPSEVSAWLRTTLTTYSN